MFEVWCARCQEPHQPNSAEGHTIKKGITPGTSVWVPLEANDAVSWKLGSVLSRCGNVVTVQIHDPLLIANLRVIDLDDTRQTELRETAETKKSKKKNKKPPKSYPKCLPANDAVVEDMTELHFTHEAAILHNLKLRAQMKEPYTFIGNVLVSINPLQEILDPIEFDDTPHPGTIAERAYNKMTFTVSQRRRLLEDHPAYLQWLDEEFEDEEEEKELLNEISQVKEKLAVQFGAVDHSILISGESGSGKTEAAKRVLCRLVDREGYGEMVYCDDRPDAFDFQNRLIGATPILESFGNALTQRNPNSSRFGKFLKLMYEPDIDLPDDLVLYGASMTTYLLEKSRVTYQEPGEKNYRIFYQMLTSPNSKLHKALGLKQAGHRFRYLGDKPFTNEDRDRSGYVDLRTAFQMADIGVRSYVLFQVVAAVLHLGNIDFAAEVTKEGEVAKLIELDLDPKAAAAKRRSVNRRSVKRMKRASTRRTQLPSAAMTGSRQHRASSGIPERGSFLTMASFQDDSVDLAELLNTSRHNYSPLVFASRLLGVKQAGLKEMLVRTKVKVGGEMITKRLDIKSATRRRDGIAKYIYSCLFDWLVARLNDNLKGQVSEGNEDFTSYIGVLDVFGFEEFEKNGFEQLLINYANEVLLSLFTREIIIGESQIYQDEGLYFGDGEMTLNAAEIPENSNCLELFEGQMVKKKRVDGLFGILDSQGRIPSPSEEKFLQQLQKSFSKQSAFLKVHPTKKREVFVIKHYASDVAYTIGTFLEKNDQSIPAELGQLLANASHEIVKSFQKLGIGSAGMEEEKMTGSKPIRRRKANKKKASAKKTVAQSFYKQMLELKSTLLNTNCSYIRCVKPNPSLFFNPQAFRLEAAEGMAGSRGKALRFTESKHQRNLQEKSRSSKKFISLKKKYFDEAYISTQLKNLGIYDCVSVLKDGFPTRMPYPSFVEMYEDIVPLKKIPYFTRYSDVFRNKMYVSALMYAFDVPRSGFKLGNTKIFFQNGQLDSIKTILKSGIRMTKMAGGSREKKKVLGKFKKYYKMRRNRFIVAKAMAVSIFLQKFRYVRAVRCIQRFARKMLFKKNLSNRITERKAAVLIQAHWRAFKGRRMLRRLKRKKADKEAKEKRRREEAEALRKKQELELKKQREEAEAQRIRELEALKEEEARAEAERLKEAARLRHLEAEKAEQLKKQQEMEQNRKEPEAEGDEEEQFPSTFSNDVYQNNAMRGNLKTYFDRRTSYNRTKRTRFQSNLNGMESPQFEDFAPVSKLSNGGSLFNYQTVEEATDNEWHEVEYLFLDFDGDDADLDMIEDDVDFEDEEVIMIEDSFEELPSIPLKAAQLSDVDEKDVDEVLSDPLNSSFRKKSALRKPKPISLQDRLVLRKNEVQNHRRLLKNSPTNLSINTVFSNDQDNFADVMFEVLQEDSPAHPAGIDIMNATFSELDVGITKLKGDSKQDNENQKEKKSKKKKSKKLSLFKKKKPKEREMERRDKPKMSVKHMDSGTNSPHISLPSGDEAEDEERVPIPPLQVRKLKETEGLSRQDSLRSLAEEGDDSSNFVKRMAAMWGSSRKKSKPKKEKEKTV